MGAVAEAVGGVVGDILDPIKKVGEIAEDVVREVGHACESVGREVGKVGQAAIDDPVGTIAKVAAIATQQYWALPLISAATVMAHGGDLGQAALAAGISYAAGVIAAGVGDYLGAGATGGLDMVTGDAAGLASQGLTASQIAEVLGQSYPEIGATALNQVAAMSTLGMTAAEIASDVGQQMATQNLLASAAGNAVGGASRVAMSGGDLNQVLMGGLTSGVGSLAGGYASQGMKDAGMNATVAKVLGSATGAAAASTVAGKDAKLSFINALINTTLTETGKQSSSILKSAWKSVNESATKFNEQLTKAQEDYQTTITPLEQEAKAAQEVAASSFDEYKAIKDKFDSVVAEYNAAKEDGDTEKANSLADQANALIPELNAATTKYNGDVEVFDNKLATFNSAADEYKTQTDAVAAAKAEYDSRNADLQKSTAELTEAGLKVADMGDNSKVAFEKLYNDGNSITTALDTVKTVDELSDVAQGSFLRQYEQNQDPTSSLEFAKKIDGLDTNSQASYAYAVNTGLDDAAAIQYAPNLSGLSKESQQVFLDGIKSGQDPKAAETSAILAEFFKQYAGETSEPSPYAPTASNPSVTVTDIGGAPVTPLVPAGTEVGTIAGSTFVYNPATGKFDIPAEIETGGTEGATSLAPSEATGTGVTPFTPEQKAAADALDTQLANNQITQEEYDAKAKAIEAGEGFGTTGTGTGSSITSSIANALNNPGLADNAFTGNAPTGGATGTAPTGTTTTTPGTGAGTTTGGTAPTGTTGNAPTTSVGTGTGGGGTTVGSTVGGTTDGTGAGTGGTGTGGTGTGSGSGTGGTGTGIGTGGTGIGVGGTGGYGYNYGYGTSGTSSDMYGGIKNLTPGLTQRMDYTLSGMPNVQEITSPVPNFATGGTTTDPFNTGIGSTNSDGSNGISASLTPGMTKAQLSYVLTGMPGSNIISRAEGGSIPEHNPQFYSEGGLSSMENRYVAGEGDGTSDSVPAMLANGEFVIPADVVSSLGNGSNEAGASVLDQFLASIRDHKHSKGSKGLPPDSKGPLSYLTDAKRKAKA